MPSPLHHSKSKVAGCCQGNFEGAKVVSVMHEKKVEGKKSAFSPFPSVCQLVWLHSERLDPPQRAGLGTVVKALKASNCTGRPCWPCKGGALSMVLPPATQPVVMTTMESDAAQFHHEYRHRVITRD